MSRWERVFAGRRAMPCQDLVETITEYLEGALPRGDRRRFEAHLADCPHCWEYVAQFQVTIEAAGRPPEADELATAERNSLLAAFHGWAA